MSQDEIFRMITDNPGITQKEICQTDKNASVQILALLNKKMVYRVSCKIPSKKKGFVGMSYRLYPATDIKTNLGKSFLCDLRQDDTPFNKGHGETFFRALDRSILRGDFK